MSESDRPTSNEVLALFQRHVVPIVITHQSDQPRACVITAFAMSVSGHWFLVTAGHVLKELDVLIPCEDQGMYFPQSLKCYKGNRLWCKGDGERRPESTWTPGK